MLRSVVSSAKGAVDPFADTSLRDEPPLDNFPEIVLPPELVPFFGESVFDVSKDVKAMGIILNEDDIAGYEPATDRIFLYTGVQDEIDKFEQLFSLGCYLSPRTLEIDLKSAGSTRILARSGQKAILVATRTEPPHKRIFDIEPTVGETDTLIDLRIRYDEIAGEVPVRSLETSATLIVGEPLVIMKETSSPPLEITTVITHID